MTNETNETTPTPSPSLRATELLSSLDYAVDCGPHPEDQHAALTEWADKAREYLNTVAGVATAEPEYLDEIGPVIRGLIRSQVESAISAIRALVGFMEPLEQRYALRLITAAVNTERARLANAKTVDTQPVEAQGGGGGNQTGNKTSPKTNTMPTDAEGMEMPVKGAEAQGGGRQ